MNAEVESTYRLRLAEGFLLEARQDIQTQRWRSCVTTHNLRWKTLRRPRWRYWGRLDEPTTLAF